MSAVDECEHETHKLRGEIRCKKCKARHVFMPGGGRWVASSHKGGWPKGRPRHSHAHHTAHRSDG